MDETNRGKLHYPPRLLAVRPQFVTISRIVLFVCFISILVTLISLAMYFYSTNQYVKMLKDNYLTMINMELYKALFSAGGVLSFCLSLIYFFYYYPALRKNYQAFNNYLLIQDGRKKKKIYFQEISGLIPSGRKVGSKFKILLKNGKVYRFSVNIERADYITDAIMKFNPKLMSHQDYMNFRLNLLMADHRLTRLNEIWKGKWKWMPIIFNFILPVGFVAFLFVTQSQNSEIQSIPYYLTLTIKLIGIICFALWLIYYGFSVLAIENEASRRLGNNYKDKKRNMGFEGKVLKINFSLIIFAVFGAFFTVQKYDVNRFELAVAVDDYSHYGVKKFQVLIVDTRYNCLNCNFPIKDNDIILFSRPDSTQRIMAKVSDAPVSNDRKIGRNPASLQKPNKLTVKGGKHGDNSTEVDRKRVVGKVYKSLYEYNVNK